MAFLFGCKINIFLTFVVSYLTGMKISEIVIQANEVADTKVNIFIERVC